MGLFGDRTLPRAGPERNVKHLASHLQWQQTAGWAIFLFIFLLISSVCSLNYSTAYGVLCMFRAVRVCSAG
jgi:hypothetical protein